MRHLRSYVAIAASAIGLSGLAVEAPYPRPPVPSKVLPSAQAPHGRVHVSPITGRAVAIRVEPEPSDSDAEEAEEIARNRALPGFARPSEEGRANPRAAAPGIVAAAPAATTANIPQSEFYEGSDRAASKLSIADAATETFDDLRDLIATLPPREDMVNHVPRIPAGPNSGRVAEENRNVRVRCWLYAASREADDDYHLILGRAPGRTPETYMTMEVSGLPPTDSASFPRLFAARKAFNDYFGAHVPGRHYDFYDPPIPVIMEGSLFFDLIHARGTPPGPSSLRRKMPVIWEVHPVTGIEFEPTP